jgi:hypothetical protein
MHMRACVRARARARACVCVCVCVCVCGWVCVRFSQHSFRHMYVYMHPACMRAQYAQVVRCIESITTVRITMPVVLTWGETAWPTVKRS